MKKIEILQKLKEILNLPDIEYKLLLDIVVRYYSSKLKDQEYVYIEQLGYLKLRKFSNQFINEDEAIFSLNFSHDNPENSNEEINLGTLRLHVPSQDSIEDLFDPGINKPVINSNLKSESDIFEEISKYDLRKAVEYRLGKYLTRPEFDDSDDSESEEEDDFIFGKEIVEDEEIIPKKPLSGKPKISFPEEKIESRIESDESERAAKQFNDFNTEEDDDSEYLFGKNPEVKTITPEEPKKRFSFDRITNTDEEEESDSESSFVFNKHFSRITSEELDESESQEPFTDYHSLKNANMRQETGKNKQVGITGERILDEAQEVAEQSIENDILDFNEIIKKKKSGNKVVNKEIPAEVETEEDLPQDVMRLEEPETETANEDISSSARVIKESEDSGLTDKKQDNETVKIKKVKNESRIWLILSFLFVLVISVLIYLRFFGLPTFLKSGEKTAEDSKKRITPVIIQRDYSIPVNYPYSPTKRLDWEKEMMAGIIQDSLVQSNQINTFNDFNPFTNQGSESPKELNLKPETKEKPETKPEKKPEAPTIEKSSLNSKMINEHIVLEDKNYIVQTSSWKNRAQAEKEAARLKKLGFDSYISESNIKGRGIWYRVRVGKYDTIEKAQQTLAKVKPHI